MKFYKNVFIMYLSLFFTNMTVADEFIMKDGSTIKASIISQTAHKYLLRAEVTRNVYGEKTVLKKDVREIIKTDPSIAAYKKISSILPTADLLPEKSYGNFIEKVEDFIKEYPSSPFINQAKSTLKTLKDELFNIKSGGLKLNGKNLSPEQIQSNKYEIEAEIILSKMVQNVKKKQYASALDTLADLEADFPVSSQCRKAQEIALDILPKYRKSLQKAYDNVDKLKAKRERVISSMSSSERSRTKKIFEQQEERYLNSLELAKSDKKQKWLPINRYFKKPIKANIDLVDKEMKRIISRMSMPTVNAARYYRNIHQALLKNDHITAKNLFAKFKEGDPPDSFMEEIEEKISEVKAIADKLEKQRIAEETRKRLEEDKKRRRLAREKRERERRLAELEKMKPNKKSVGETIKDKLNLNKKQEQIDKLNF